MESEMLVEEDLKDTGSRGFVKVPENIFSLIAIMSSYVHIIQNAA